MSNNINAFVPEIWSKKLGLVEKSFSNFINNMCNRDYEGEIKNFGDVVRITTPDPDSIIIGTGVIADTSSVHPKQKTLTIDKARNFGFWFNDIEQKQSQIGLLEGHMNMAMQKMMDTINQEVMQAVFDNSDVETYGTSTTALTASASTIYNLVTNIKVKLISKGVLNSEGYYTYKGEQELTKSLSPVLTVSPFIYGMMLQSTHLTHPTVAGDDILKSGQRKQIAGFEIVCDTILDKVTGVSTANDVYAYIAGTKTGITFANQFDKIETLRDPQQFADIVRGIMLYGYTTVQPKSLIKGFMDVTA